MEKTIVVFMSMFMLLESVSLHAWGPVGHDIVAAIAEPHLTRKAKREINRLLEGKSIIYYSSWMDNLRNSPHWESSYRVTGTWHYANVDEGYTYQTMEKEEKGDVVKALEQLTDAMEDHYSELSDSMKVDYLKMIVHMVGDLHCPMHAGRRTDRGGNGVQVKWFGNRTNIHSVWDSKLVESAHRWSYSEWVEHLDRTDRKFRKSVMSGTYEAWFNDTVAHAADIYEYIDGLNQETPNLSYQYVYDYTSLVEQQLLLGGYRLAYVLNKIFSGR